MFLKNIFSEFVEVVKENSNYILGLINLQGYIVSCSQSQFEGLKSKATIKDDKNNFVEKIEVNHKILGYLWVYSKDENLKMVAKLLNESLNNRIMYEINEEDLNKRMSKEEKLVNYFIGGETFKESVVSQLFEELHIEKDRQRIAVIIYREQSFTKDEFINIKFNQRAEGSIYSMVDENSILVFKTVMSSGKDINQLSSTDIKHFVQKIENLGIKNCSFLVGSLQKIGQYHRSYQECKWLKDHLMIRAGQIFFFENYLYEYLMSKIPMKDLAELDLKRINDKRINTDKVIEIAEQLYQNNFNVTKAADCLFMHKNTLTYELKKYEQIFSIDVRGSFQGKVVFYLIAMYFKRIKHQNQVGDID